MNNFVIIGGFPRSGTRQFADIINQHEKFNIQAEIYTPVYRSIARLVKHADENHTGKRTQKSYFNRRNQAAFETYRFFSKTNSQPKAISGSEEWFGVKQPYIEVMHEESRIIFGYERAHIDHFICLRNVRDNFLSLSSAFGYSLDDYSRKTIRSVQSMRVMDQQGFFKMWPLSLDEYIGSPSKEGWIYENIFKVLDVETDKKWRDWCLSKVGNANKTPSDIRRKKIRSDEVEYLLHNTELVSEVEWVENRFNVDLLGKLRLESSDD